MVQIIFDHSFISLHLQSWTMDTAVISRHVDNSHLYYYDWICCKDLAFGCYFLANRIRSFTYQRIYRRRSRRLYILCTY